MVKLVGTFGNLRSEKVMVVGDFLLDTYTIGKARRISPEAPVPVVQVQHEESRPGGAGNAILNLASLGAKVVTLGRVGQDSSGELVKQLLDEELVDISGILVDSTFRTPIKNRIIAENQQVVRVDHEWVTPLPEILENQVILNLPLLLDGVKVVAISDYGKGFLTPRLLRSLIDEAKRRQILIIADPKGLDFSRYRGVHILKPNLSEAYAAAGLSSCVPLDEAAQKILQLVDAEHLMITQSEAGISTFSCTGERKNFPTKIREVKDTTGAGDTVLAMLTLALASGLDLSQAAELSNIAAGIAIEHLGCSRVSLPEIAERLLKMHVGNKIFEREHFPALQQALKGLPYTLLPLKEEDLITPDFIAHLMKVKEQKDQMVVISLEQLNPSENLIKMLASLHSVDFVVLK